MTVKKPNTQDLDELLKKISEAAVKACNTNPMFGDKCGEVDQLVLDYTKMRGGHAHLPTETKFRVTDINTLVEMFYFLCEKTDPAKKLQFYKNDVKIDLKIAKLFVESRKDACGYSIDVAIKNCAEIINTVFCNIDEFYFNTAISFTIFGQDKMAWVTEKALRLIEKRKEYEKEEEMNQLEEENQKWLLAKVERGEVKLGMLDENENDDYIARWRKQHPEQFNKKRPDPVAQLHEHIKNRPPRVIKEEEKELVEVDPVAAAIAKAKAHFEERKKREREREEKKNNG
jgi:hypothetical protein